MILKDMEAKFYPMDVRNLWNRPQFLKAGYTFRNEGGEGDIVFTLLEDYDPDKNIHGNIHVVCHHLLNNHTHVEVWDDCEYLEGSFKNGEYYPYFKYCNWLAQYYI